MQLNPSLPPSALNVRVIQNSAGKDIGHNLQKLDKLLENSTALDLIALPEVFAFRGCDDDYRQNAELIDGSVFQHLSRLSRQYHAWILAGSIIEKSGTQIFNTSLLLNRSGDCVAIYRKIHLFEAYLEDGQVIREQNIYHAGDKPVIASIDGWRCGIAICYDLRFPEFFRYYAGEGAHLFLVPSNFTQRTGKDHWETLLRARAIENQVFVVAPNQCGANPCSKIVSYGHSLVIGPWGEILCSAGDEECALDITLDPASLDSTRRRIPVLTHRKLPI